jgi:hypothetical protein
MRDDYKPNILKPWNVYRLDPGASDNSGCRRAYTTLTVGYGDVALEAARFWDLGPGSHDLAVVSGANEMKIVVVEVPLAQPRVREVIR